MNKVLDNKKAKVSDALLENIEAGGKLSVTSAYFTIYAYEKLKEALLKIKELRFLFLEPTFIETKDEQREFYINKLNREKRLSGTEYEIKLRNELTQSQIAKECAEWIENKVAFRSLKKEDVSNARIIHVKNPNSEFIITGTLDFTSSGLGFSNSKKIEMNMLTSDKSATKEALDWFNETWDNPKLVEDVKDEVLKNIQVIYKENTPEFIYFITLYNIFKEYISELTEDNIIKSKTGFKDTLVWNKLYKFQKDGVIGAIEKLEKHNGCIIADSVGLGKTFEALAVIKYYELRNDRVLVLCPKKLRDNWLIYTINDKRNILDKDRFNYDVLNHTDLSREKGYSGDIDLKMINWGNYDLVVIDESHNFRNNDPRIDRKTRYKKLMDDVIKAGVKTKVLMLSATPVNNRLNDLKNQVAFITEANDGALLNEGINSIEVTLRNAQSQFNRWLDKPAEERKLESLLSHLNVDYFKLLDALTIARSRRHIEKYYNLDEIGKFPERLKPINVKAKVDLKNEFPNFEIINDSIRRLTLAIYSPLKYVKPDKAQKYAEQYDKKVKGGTVYFKQIDRERSLVNLMRVNILKRLESSIYSFHITLDRIIKKIKEEINRINNYSDADFYELNTDDEGAILFENDEQAEAMLSGSKTKVFLHDIDLIRWKQDLESDLERLLGLISQSELITVERDAKLAELKQVIANKIKQPINASNQKIIIFSAFADTAQYLYNDVSKWANKEFHLHSALVTGGGPNKVTLDKIPTDLSSILINFSPLSKEKEKIYPEIKENIDILIATDCVSEGQNLQDCDWLINYDIHWNPVRIIQRFGRIDRIGSKNDRIQLLNFWPDMELDEYIKLEQRVRGRMVLLNSSATGEDDIINETEQDVMNDIEYRKNQLVQLQEKVVDLEDISGNISITDMTMNDFKMDLMEYLKDHNAELEKAPLGMYAIARADAVPELNPGVIFVLKQASFSEVESTETNALHPYYLVHIQEDGEIKLTYSQAKYILDIFKKLCNGNSAVHHDLVELFNKETKEAKDMSKYSELLRQSIYHIIGQKQEDGLSQLFNTIGKTSIARDSSLNGLEDFELVSFLIIK
jgi:Helicase conserved C-terminal domain/SNF2-related domain